MTKKTSSSIYSALRDNAKNFLQEIVNPNLEDEAIVNGYFSDYRYNIFGGKMEKIFIDMFNDGDGNELATKASAFHSSSMLAYNFFHWINEERELKVTFQDGETISYNKVIFEVKIPVLRRSKANMDIVLRNSKGAWLFIESKFTEFMNLESFSISDTYKQKPNSYYNPKIGEKWTDFISNYDTTKKNQYWPGIKQEMCHLIGLTNWITAGIEIYKDNLFSEKYKKNGDVRFINIVFEPNKHRFPNEHRKMEEYQERYINLHEQLRNKGLIPEGLQMEFMTYSQIWPNIKQSNLPEGLENYLNEHYMKLAE